MTRISPVSAEHPMPPEKPDGWIVKNKHGAIELFLHHERAIDAFNAWGSFIGPVYQQAPAPGHAQTGQQWMPIATAPKGNAPVLLYCHSLDIGPPDFSCVGYRYNRQWSNGHEYVGATHWQPLPAAPSDTSTDQNTGSRLTFCEACNGNTMHRRAAIVDGVQTFECQSCALARKVTSSSPCLNCGDPSDEPFCGMCREMGCSVSSTDRPFDPTEWEKIIEDRQERVAISSPAQGSK